MHYATIIMDKDPILRTKAQAVALPLSLTDKETLQQMLKYIEDSKVTELAEQYQLKPGIGLAAPQIGISRRLMVVDFSENINDQVIDYKFALANPVIISHSEQESCLANGEGCLSVAEEYPGYVYRAARVTVSGYDLLTDQIIKIRASGLLSLCLQHEIDHLNGILFYDHINQTDPWLKKPNTIEV